VPGKQKIYRITGVQWSAEGKYELPPDRTVIDTDGRMSLRRIDNPGRPRMTCLSLVLPNPDVPYSNQPPYPGAGIMLLVEVPTAKIKSASLKLLRTPA